MDLYQDPSKSTGYCWRGAGGDLNIDQIVGAGKVKSQCQISHLINYFLIIW